MTKHVVDAICLSALLRGFMDEVLKERWQNTDILAKFLFCSYPGRNAEMDQTVHRLLRFDRFVLDLTRGCLRTDDRDIGLRPKTFKVLRHLAENAGRLVSKQELYEIVWPNIVVSDDSLVQCVRELRQALGDDKYCLIKTVSRRGYLLDVAVSSSDIPAAPVSPAATTASRHPSTEDENIDRDALAGERKHATVLHADLKESLELVADDDPAKALKIFDGILKLMRQAAQRYDGTVIQETADGIVALFGVPFAQEDHAVRACYAAWQIQGSVKQLAQELHRSTPVPITVRVGVNSGEVTVGSTKTSLHTHYRTLGQTTRLASRLGQIAAPGKTLVSAATLRLAEGHFEVKLIEGAIASSQGYPVYELVAARPRQTRFGVLAARGLTRFVGREFELEQLNRARRLARSGRGQVVAVVGEAGVGKSRLAFEFARSLRQQGWRVLESASVSYGKATSYLPVIALLKVYFKIQDRDDHSQIREKVTHRLLVIDEGLKQTLPAVLNLLDVRVEDAAWERLHPTQRRQRTLDAIKLLLLREAQEGPLLVILEDLHWMDGETQALLDGLIGNLGSARLLLLVNYRPEYQHAWGSKTYYSQLRLDALQLDSTAEMLEALLGEDPGLASLKKLLVKRGNPFFLEETVRSLIETKTLVGERGHYRLSQPVQELQAPPTVQLMLAARIDRLAPEDKRLLQVASVIGKDVPFSLLQAIADVSDEALRHGLDGLQSAEFLYETGLFPDVGYSFKHALSHEVVYGGLLQEDRRQLHARTLDAIETCHRDRLGEQIERLAHHAVQGELRQRAVHYLLQAGLKTAARSAPKEARVWFEQALSIIEVLPKDHSILEQEFQIRIELHWMVGVLGETWTAREHLRAAQIIAERMNDDNRRGQVLARMTLIHAQLGELEESLAAGSRALELDRRLGGGSQFHRTARSHLSYTHYLRGEYEQGAELTKDSLRALPTDWASQNYITPDLVYDRGWRIVNLAELGRFAEAARLEAEMMRIAEPMQHAHTVGFSYFAASALHLGKGNWKTARSFIEQGLAAFRTGNVIIQLRNLSASSAWVLAQLGLESEALNRLRESQDLLEHLASTGYAAGTGRAYYSLGRACLLLGRLHEAQNWGERAIITSPSHFGFRTHALHLLGDVATHPDRFNAESAKTYYHQALRLADSRGMQPVIAHCQLGLGKLHSRLGELRKAQQHFSIAATMYRDMDMKFWLEQMAQDNKTAKVSSPSRN